MTLKTKKKEEYILGKQSSSLPFMLPRLLGNKLFPCYLLLGLCDI